MKAILINKNGITFDVGNFETKEKAMEWSKGRGKCHLTIEVNEEKGVYLNYKIFRNKAYRSLSGFEV